MPYRFLAFPRSFGSFSVEKLTQSNKNHLKLFDASERASPKDWSQIQGREKRETEIYWGLYFQLRMD